MEYGVFQIDSDNKLVLVGRYNIEQEAIKHAKTGGIMVVLPIYS